MRNFNMRDDGEHDVPSAINTRQSFLARIEALHCLLQEHDADALAIKATWGWGRIMHKLLCELYFGQRERRGLLFAMENLGIR